MSQPAIIVTGRAIIVTGRAITTENGRAVFSEDDIVAALEGRTDASPKEVEELVAQMFDAIEEKNLEFRDRQFEEIHHLRTQRDNFEKHALMFAEQRDAHHKTASAPQ